jgi:hypothetical protein
MCGSVAKVETTSIEVVFVSINFTYLSNILYNVGVIKIMVLVNCPPKNIPVIMSDGFVGLEKEYQHRIWNWWPVTK